MRVDSMNVSKWKHQWVFCNTCVVWDTPMAKWASEGKDWVQEMAMHQPKKDEVITASRR